MIKSKIDARERALEFVKPSDFTTVDEQIECAKKIEAYLIGSADLPEVFDDNRHLKELFEVAKREMEKINKRDYNYDLTKAMHPECAVTCKSDAE